MNTYRPLLKSLVSLWRYIGKQHQHQLVLLLGLMIIVTVAEIISIGAIFPFLTVLTSPDKVFELTFLHFFFRFFGLVHSSQLILPFSVAFCLMVLLAGCMRMLLVLIQTRVSFMIGADLALDVYRKTLYQPYSDYIKQNSSEVISGVYSKASSISNYIILPVLTIFSAIMLLLGILSTLLVVDPLTSSIALGGFALIYSIVIKVSHRPLLRNSELVAHEAGRVIKSLQEGLGGFRDVIIDQAQEIYCGIFRKADLSMRAAQINSNFIAQSPRFVVEMLGMLLFVILAYKLAIGPGGISSAVPVLGALALGAQRMLPISQQAYQAWSSIQSNRASLVDVLDLLDKPLPDQHSCGCEMIEFNRDIQICNLSFRYGLGSDWVLKDVNLNIPKGSRVGFIGATGSGKSTLLDIIMGLLEPTIGELLIDSILVDLNNINKWQKRIAHVPQSIFFADTSIERNIAFGELPEKIDRERVRWASKQANILDTIESWPNKFETVVGERGICLSGGQRQRIGIARALYKRADVLIFDEATNALDNETEQSVMESIQSLGPQMTVLIITHRLDTLDFCDFIVKLDSNKIIKILPRAQFRSDL